MLPRSEELFFHPQHPAEDSSNQELYNWFGDIDDVIQDIFSTEPNPAEFFDLLLMDDEIDDGGGGGDDDMNSENGNGNSFGGSEELSILVEHSRNPFLSETASDRQHSPVQTPEVWWWSSKDYPLQNIRQPIDPWKEIEGQILLPPKLVFGELNSVPESANLVNSCTSIPPTTPYTPDTDHCYNKPKSEEIKCERIKCEPIEEESDSDSSGDEVDIETVSDDGQKICAMKFERTIRRPAKPKRYSQRENTPPVRIKGGLNKRETARAVSAMLKLKRTSNCKMYQQDSKTAVRTKRGRRPAHSLPVSPGSSRSNSDTEEPVVKRSMHNNMERMRRNQQRMALHCLRDRIPELKHNPKISKVKIINKAREYIKSLVQREREQEETIRKLLKKQLKLRKKVNYLLQM